MQKGRARTEKMRGTLHAISPCSSSSSSFPCPRWPRLHRRPRSPVSSCSSCPSCPRRLRLSGLLPGSRGGRRSRWKGHPMPWREPWPGVTRKEPRLDEFTRTTLLVKTAKAHLLLGLFSGLLLLLGLSLNVTLAIDLHGHVTNGSLGFPTTNVRGSDQHRHQAQKTTPLSPAHLFFFLSFLSAAFSSLTSLTISMAAC